MDSSRHSITPAPNPAPQFVDLGYFDDDVALGCESADPALQIERWGQEAPPLRELD